MLQNNMKLELLHPELICHEESFWLFGLETRQRENITNEYWGTIFLVQCKLLKRLLSTASASFEDIWQIGVFVPAGPLTGHLELLLSMMLTYAYVELHVILDESECMQSYMHVIFR